MRGYEIADEKSHKFYNRQIKKLHERMLQMIHPCRNTASPIITVSGKKPVRASRDGSMPSAEMSSQPRAGDIIN